MTENELKKRNPWVEIADKLDCLCSDTTEFVYSKDVDMVRAFNKRVAKSKNCKQGNHPSKLILNVPPEPWQGNPLKAKVIFLSLNPGFVEDINWKVAKLLQNDKGILERMLAFHKKTLRLEIDSFFPETNDEQPIGFKDSISMHGGWYWEKGLAKLLEKVANNNYTEKQFYRDVAIIQYHSYSSTKYGMEFTKPGYYLESQKFTAELIKYILENKGTMFVVMRSFKYWKELLEEDDKDFWEKYENRFHIKDNGSMSQTISEKNLILKKDGTNLFDLICNKLRE